MDSLIAEISSANLLTTAGSAFGGDSYTAIYAQYILFVPAAEFFTDHLQGQTNETALVLFFNGADFDLYRWYVFDQRKRVSPSE